MKALIQRLSLDGNSSFVARTYKTPDFETPWHQHPEIELMIITEGFGTAFVGDKIGDYQAGEVYLLGENLPHWFRKHDKTSTGASIVVHFREDFLGKDFFEAPEMKNLKQLLRKIRGGLRLKGTLNSLVGKRLLNIETQKGFTQMIELLEILHQISISDELEYLNSFSESYQIQDQELLNNVFEYSIQNFKNKIQLSDVAALCNLSISAFCHYFKKSTKKSYIQFLNEIKISHACKLLEDTSLSVTQICYDSGYRNWSNFSTQFRAICGDSPSEFRKKRRLK